MAFPPTAQLSWDSASPWYWDGDPNHALSLQNEGVRWTAGGGMVGLGLRGNSTAQHRHFRRRQRGCGRQVSVPYFSGSQAFRWTASGGMVEAEAERAIALATTRLRGTCGDGSIVVGHAADLTGDVAFVLDKVA